MKKRMSKKIRRKSKETKLTFFYEVLVLIVSLLHGTLFFVLAEQAIDLINNFSFWGLSKVVFFFILFLRIFQTHILAAIKYSEKWLFKSMDFILVFLTALFEYILFSSHRILDCGQTWYLLLILIFCIFGISSYGITYLRVRNSYSGNAKRNELRIQIINIICIFIIGILYLLCYFKLMTGILKLTYVNFISAIILLINMYFSLQLSKEELRKFLHIENK